MNFEKFNNFLPRRLGARSISVEQDLLAAEKTLGINFIEEHQKILMRFEGAVLFDNRIGILASERVPVGDEDGTVFLNVLFGVAKDPNGLRENYDVYIDQLPENLVPFGGSSGGNLFCLDRMTGSVAFWVHDSLPQEKETFLVADSMSKFLDELRIIPEDTSFDDEVVWSTPFLKT
jgi:hypothetical protein